MKKRKTKPTASKFTVLRQLCNLIPPHLIPKLARETGVDSMARSFSAWSHVVSMLFAQLTHAIGLNDVCDALRLHSGPLSALRGATPPSRNNLSHANKRRDAELAERLFWAVLEHLQKLSPGFATGRRGKGLARRFRRVIHVVDSSTIALTSLLHRLGTTPSAQSRRQATCTSGPAQSTAALCLGRIGKGCR